jgi:hypothetical protein
MRVMGINVSDGDRSARVFQVFTNTAYYAAISRSPDP